MLVERASGRFVNGTLSRVSYRIRPDTNTLAKAAALDRSLQVLFGRLLFGEASCQTGFRVYHRQTGSFAQRASLRG
jgi:hypothetical protein